MTRSALGPEPLGVRALECAEQAAAIGVDDIGDPPAGRRLHQAQAKVAEVVRAERDPDAGACRARIGLAQADDLNRQPAIVLAVAQRVAVERSDFAARRILGDRGHELRREIERRVRQRVEAVDPVAA